MNANSWAQRKDGVPLFLLDNLSFEERMIAEAELIASANGKDSWPVLGLAHLKSVRALPLLYNLLDKYEGKHRLIISYAIYKICNDIGMADIVITEIPRVTGELDLIEILYLLPEIKDDRITALLNSYREHKDYLIAYNATRALGLSTDEVVRKFRAS